MGFMFQTRLCAVSLFLAVLAVVLLIVETTAQEEFSCASRQNYTTSGRCRSYPSTGYCRNGYANRQVWMANGSSFDVYDTMVKDSVDLLRRNSHQTTEACLSLTETWVCARFYPDCTTVDGIDIPKLLCKAECETYWETCRNAFELYYTAAVVNFQLIAVEDVNLVHCGTTGTFQAGPQPSDVFGVREIPLSPTWLEGYRGELRAPPSAGIFTMPNGTNISIPCHTMTALTAPLTTEVVCAYPLEPVQNGSQTICQIPCPFPVIPLRDLRSIGWAFVIPGIIGVVFSVFVCLDALWVMFDTSGGGTCYRYTRRIFSVGKKQSNHSRTDSVIGENVTSRQRNDSSTADSPVHRRGGGKIRSSQVYALLGSTLGIIYFIIGPLMTLLRSEKISCGSADHFDIAELRAGRQTVGDGMCRAQRVAPFVLQGIFNLMLYALLRVLIMVDHRFKRWTPGQVSLVRNSAIVYCFFGPLVCMAIALGLDETTDDITLLFGQLARQSAVCTMQISRAQEIILIFMPFIFTGCGITCLSLYIFSRLSTIQAGVKEITAHKRGSDRALSQLMTRLSVLGVATFVVILILICTTGYVINTMEHFSPRFSAWFTCESTSSLCTTTGLDCPALREEAFSITPSYSAFAVQIAAMSCISLLLSGFFAAQAAPRFYQEFMSGNLSQKLDNILEGRPLHYNIGNSSSVQPENVKSSPVMATQRVPASVASRAPGKVHLASSNDAEVAAYMVGDIGQSPVFANEASQTSRRVATSDD